MELRARLETKLREGTVGEQFYTPNEVRRETVYTYGADRPVYELTAPRGDVYIMQSYAQIKNKSLTIDDLPSLGSRLALPEGWTYSTRTLSEDYELVTTGLAYVINDDYDAPEVAGGAAACTRRPSSAGSRAAVAVTRGQLEGQAQAPRRGLHPLERP